jgi:glyoxylase-like metal-dependent hydrolase (beta-lactamase superfamily II)
LRDSPPGHPEIERVVAPNPGPMTLDGTNTYVVESGGAAWVIDPGPADAAHVAAVREAAERRGGIGGVLLTHSHLDHTEAVGQLDGPLVWGSIGSDDESTPTSGAGATDERWPPEEPTEPIGPFRVVPTPGHSVDHVCLLLGRVCFSGDLVLGAGSSFVPPDGGSLAAYLGSLARMRALDLELLCPGHGPFVTDPAGKIDEYRDHRLDRERKLLAALADGIRSRQGLLERAWDDVPGELRPAAAHVLQAHLEKLEAEGRLAASELTD